jgi:hypothetical protein
MRERAKRAEGIGTLGQHPGVVALSVETFGISIAFDWVVAQAGCQEVTPS